MTIMYYPYPPNDRKHKYYAINKSGKTIKFGAIGYSDFTIRQDEKRKLLPLPGTHAEAAQAARKYLFLV